MPRIGFKHSQESKDKMSEKAKERKPRNHSQETKNKITEALTGRKPSSETIEKLSKAHKGHVTSQETKKKLSEMMKRRWQNPNDPLNSDECRMKCRIIRIAEIESKGGISPNFNPKACEAIDDYGKEHGYNFQHALKGGEYHIRELGYFVDGYDKEKNVVIEYLEPAHFSKMNRASDIKRKQEILDLLKCEFIELIQ